MFQKPQHALLHQLGFTYVDMHNHSQYSDTTTRIHTIAKRMRKLQLAVALTDHNEVMGNITLARENPDLLVIPGLELTTKERAHMLMYFYSRSDMAHFFEKHVKDFRGKNPNFATAVTLSNLCDHAIDYNAILAPAHPFAIPKMFSFMSAVQKHGVEQRVLENIDAVEVICGANLRHMNMQAVDWAQHMEKGIIGGSDSHSLSTLGNVVTITHGSTIAEILDAVKKRQTAVVGTEAKLYQRTLPYAIIASQHLKYVKPIVASGCASSYISTKKYLVQKMGVEKRAVQRVGLSNGVKVLADELNKGYPSIRKPVMVQKMSSFFKRR
jgi:predicted metal-dependent phosphoesterase TrpH